MVRRKIDLMYHHEGDTTKVYNRNTSEKNKPVLLAEIDPDGYVTIFQKDLPSDIIEEIENVADNEQVIPHLEKILQEMGIVISYKVIRNFLHVLFIDKTGDMWHGYGKVTDQTGQLSFTSSLPRSRSRDQEQQRKFENI